MGPNEFRQTRQSLRPTHFDLFRLVGHLRLSDAALTAHSIRDLDLDYEGWRGQVYNKTYPKSRFKHDCLAEYATYAYQGAPLFRTVGIDHSFYGLPSAKLLAHYASILPPGLRPARKSGKKSPCGSSQRAPLCQEIRRESSLS